MGRCWLRYRLKGYISKPITDSYFNTRQSCNSLTTAQAASAVRQHKRRSLSFLPLLLSAHPSRQPFSAAFERFTITIRILCLRVSNMPTITADAPLFSYICDDPLFSIGSRRHAPIILYIHLYSVSSYMIQQLYGLLFIIFSISGRCNIF